ncbi:MAG: sigma 54-interacting transcriptional regulator [Solidesulfovibrio sp.]
MTTAAPEITEALGQSDAFLAFMEQVTAVARVSRPVVLVGERGTGKELAAARLHFHSPRWAGPFVAVNLSALPKTLLESELFGHEAGAFTGAVKRRPGRFEAADGGTLFLDELQAAPKAVQEKLLRVLEYGTLERLGTSETVTVDVRVVAAANVDLRELVRRGRLLPDLLDRLAFTVLYAPPLRNRHGDIPYLAARFAARFAAELGRPDPPKFTPATMAVLCAHDWPGNIRELKNVVERAVFENPGTRIAHVVTDPFNHPDAPAAPPTSSLQGGPGGIIPPGGDRGSAPVDCGSNAPSWRAIPASFHAAVAVFEKGLMERALTRAGGNQRRAAALLGLTYDQFRGLYRKHAGKHPADTPK